MSFERLFASRWVSVIQLARYFWKSGRLIGRLLGDPRVPAHLKLLFFSAVVYILSPVDLFPEIIFPLIGVADDVGLLIVTIKLFLRWCPRDVVMEHVRHIQRG
jgi:uncharacterized membrane protein YkvA (DUF1232 family)